MSDSIFNLKKKAEDKKEDVLDSPDNISELKDEGFVPAVDGIIKQLDSVMDKMRKLDVVDGNKQLVKSAARNLAHAKKFLTESKNV
jgi:hypothetical protein